MSLTVINFWQNCQICAFKPYLCRQCWRSYNSAVNVTLVVFKFVKYKCIHWGAWKSPRIVFVFLFMSKTFSRYVYCLYERTEKRLYIFVLFICGHKMCDLFHLCFFAVIHYAVKPCFRWVFCNSSKFISLYWRVHDRDIATHVVPFNYNFNFIWLCTRV